MTITNDGIFVFYKLGGLMKNSIKSLVVFISSLFLSFSAFAGGHAYTGPDLSGQKVVMFGPWLSPEQETMR